MCDCRTPPPEAMYVTFICFDTFAKICFVHYGLSGKLTIIYFRTEQIVYPPNKDHCDQFCTVQRIKDRLCAHGFVACPGCGNIYDGHAQCCYGLGSDLESSDESVMSDGTDEWDSDIEIVAEIKKPLC